MVCVSKDGRKELAEPWWSVKNVFGNGGWRGGGGRGGLNRGDRDVVSGRGGGEKVGRVKM